MKIDGTMMLNDILNMDPDIAEVFKRHGLSCHGCPAARSESLQEAAEGHNLDLQLLVEDLNSYLERMT